MTYSTIKLLKYTKIMTRKKKGDADKVFHVGVTAKSSAEGHYTVFVGDIAIGVFYFSDDEADIKLEQLIKANADVIADAVIEQMLITYEVPKSPVHLVSIDGDIDDKKQAKEIPCLPIEFKVHCVKNASITCDKCGDSATRSISVNGSSMSLCPICKPERIIADDEI